MLEKPVQIAEDLNRRADTLQMMGEYVLIECNANDSMIGNLHVPLEAAEVYPTSGWIVGFGPKVKERISVGDFVLIEEEGIVLPTSYYDVFEIILRLPDESLEGIWVEVEVEPVVKEEVSKFRRGGPDSMMAVKDTKTNESVSFNCSDVVDWQIGDMANPSYDLTYVPVHMYIFLNEDDEPALFYITQPRKIISKVEY
jgi:hypothetical protein